MKKEIPKDISPTDVEHFSALSLAQPTFTDPSFFIYPISPRTVHTSDHQHSHTLMGRTWNTPETIAHMLTFAKTQPPSEPAEVRRFYTFGTGLNAHPAKLHGGVLAAILDSTLSTTAYVGLQQMQRDKGATIATVQLNVRYQKPVSTPGSLAIVSKVVRVEDGGRKIWVEGSVRSGKNGEVSHAKAEGMWLRIKLPSGKL